MWSHWGEMNDFPHRFWIPERDAGKLPTSPRRTHNRSDAGMSSEGTISRTYPAGFPTNTHPLLLLGCYSLRKVIINNTVERS